MPHNVIIGISETGFRTLEKPQHELVGLVRAHDERLTALLDKPVLLQVEWKPGDTKAVVSIIPAHGGKITEAEAKTPFETFTLAFPESGLRLVR